MSQVKHLKFNVLTLRLIMLWPPEGRASFSYNLKSLSLLIIVYLSAYTCIYGIFRPLFVESDGYDVVIQRVIAVIDFIGFVYMRYCFLNKIQNVKSLIKELPTFGKFCGREEIEATERKVEQYSKAVVVYWFFGNALNCLAPLSDRKHCSSLRKSQLYVERDPCGLMARCFYPFDVSKNLFPVAYFIQMYTCFMISYYIIVLTMILIGVMMHILTQLKNCRKLIYNLRKEIPEKEFLKEKVRRIIIYHIKIINFTVTVLKLSYLWSENSDNWKTVKDASLIVSLMPCALPILADFLIQITGNVFNMVTITENLIALICIIGMIYMTICFVKNRQLVKSLVKNLQTFTKYSKASDLIETDLKANLYTKIFIFYGIVGNVVYMIMPYLNIEKCQIRQKEKMSNFDPPCGLVTRCWFPFKFDYSPVFEIVFVHQFYTCTMVSVIILDLTMLICGILMHITNQLKHLRNFIRNFDCVDQKIVKDVIYCIKFHTAIITYSEKTNEAFGTMMMLHITLTSLVISALGFEILIVNNFNDSLRFTLHLLGWLVLLLLICYYGQLLIDESIAVAEDIYYVPWHLAPVDVQKNIYMILMRSQKPLTLSAANIGVMSFPTFLRVISSAYSYFTLLLNIKS